MRLRLYSRGAKQVVSRRVMEVRCQNRIGSGGRKRWEKVAAEVYTPRYQGLVNASPLCQKGSRTTGPSARSGACPWTLDPRWRGTDRDPGPGSGMGC